MSEDDDEVLREIRSRSRRVVFQVFTTLALVSLGVGLTAHHAPDMFALPSQEGPEIARGFLYMGAAYAATLFAWDWMFGAE